MISYIITVKIFSEGQAKLGLFAPQISEEGKMGKVFTFDEIKHKCVPELGSFNFVLDELKDWLSKSPAIIGAIICGSAVTAVKFNRRSDIDCVVIHRQDMTREAVEVYQNLQQFAAKRFVPLELITFDDLTVRQHRNHLFSCTFGRHLARSANKGGIIKTNPLPDSCLFCASRNSDIVNYLCHKLETISKGLNRMPIMDEAELCRFLQKVLEAPIHIARKMLELNNRLVDDSKQAVRGIYLSTATQKEKDYFQVLCDFDKDYSEELEAQLESIEPTRYQNQLDLLKNAAYLCHDFIRINLAKLSEPAS